MALNKEKVRNFIINEVRREKVYYPDGVANIKRLDIYYLSFGALGFRIEGDYGEKEAYHLYRYDEIELAVSEWVRMCYKNFLEWHYIGTKKRDTTLYNLKFLYDNHLKFNNSYLITKDLIIYFISCDEFIITSNYYGTVALGLRDWNEKTRIAEYRIKEVNNSFNRSTLSKLCTKYEREKLEVKEKIIINFIEGL